MLSFQYMQANVVFINPLDAIYIYIYICIMNNI